MERKIRPNQPDEIRGVFLEGGLRVRCVDDDGRHRNGDPPDYPVRNTVPIQNVPVSREYNQISSMGFEEIRDMFRHGVFPDALCLVEEFEIPDVLMCMHSIDFLEKGTLILICEIDMPCNLIPFLRG